MKRFNYILTIIFLFFCTNSMAQKNESADAKNNPKTLENNEAVQKTDEKIEEKKLDNLRRGNFAVVQALNKTTAKTSILELKVGEKANFGNINIIPHKCLQAPLDQKPENKILLEIIEITNEGVNKISEKRIFYGWMFSSSPSLSGLEHPIYDIIAINCKNK